MRIISVVQFLISKVQFEKLLRTEHTEHTEHSQLSAAEHISDEALKPILKTQ